MYYKRRENPDVSTRKLITISVPPPLLKRAEQIAREENRSKSELLREALRFYIDTREVRKTAMQERTLALIDEIQSRAKGVPAKRIREVVREAVAAARRVRRRATA
jgi:CopG family transcriptional regulator/antitoxin EndoAI